VTLRVLVDLHSASLDRWTGLQAGAREAVASVGGQSGGRARQRPLMPRVGDLCGAVLRERSRSRAAPVDATAFTASRPVQLHRVPLSPPASSR
jgi:hypothetical protein